MRYLADGSHAGYTGGSRCVDAYLLAVVGHPSAGPGKGEGGILLAHDLLTDLGLAAPD